MTTPSKRPPADRGQGRKSLSTGTSPVLRLRVSPDLLVKVQANGAQWARDALEKAKPLPQTAAKRDLIRAQGRIKG